MSFFNKILNSLFSNSQELLSPIPREKLISPTWSSKPKPTPKPTPKPEPYRNPNIDYWFKQKPVGLKPDEMLSATKIASKKHDIPQDLLMDIAGLESMVGYDPNSYKENESGALGPFQFLAETAKGLDLEPESRLNATASAVATAKALHNKRLTEWDVIDKPGAAGNKLTDWYSEKELMPYVSKDGEKRREMLQKLARFLLQ